MKAHNLLRLHQYHGLSPNNKTFNQLSALYDFQNPYYAAVSPVDGESPAGVLLTDDICLAKEDAIHLGQEAKVGLSQGGGHPPLG